MSEALLPLPEGREYIAGMNQHFAKVCGTITAYSADETRDYAARCVAAERERWAQHLDALEAMSKDAERYRWLRDRATSCHEQQNTPSGTHYPTTWRIVTGGSDTNIDEAIDAEIKRLNTKGENCG